MSSSLSSLLIYLPINRENIMKRILINSSYGDELRVALVDGAKLYDLDTESPDRVLLKGSIFKATVSRIETSLDAAFVNFGSERHGFLPLKDLSSDFFEKNSNGKTQRTLKEGQEIIVQIAKDSFNSLDATKAISIAIDIHNDENPAHVLIWSGNSHYTEENALYNSEKENNLEVQGSGKFWGFELKDAKMMSPKVGSHKLHHHHH